jgi:hypothetical protein
MSKTDALDLSGACLLTVFGYAIWPPLALLVFGTALLLASRELVQRKGDS